MADEFLVFRKNIFSGLGFSLLIHAGLLSLIFYWVQSQSFPEKSSKVFWIEEAANPKQKKSEKRNRIKTGSEPKSISTRNTSTATESYVNTLLTTNTLPAYPKGSRLRKEQGTVLVQVTFSSENTLETVSLKQSSGYLELDEAAVAAVRGWHFSMVVHTQKSPDSLTIPIQFLLDP